ncbi:hypothetical protein J6590_028682 [Homalodisca vitripennis]|nr:hypothetical protein J6590_028682 [Homalodisca vitripennis]
MILLRDPYIDTAKLPVNHPVVAKCSQNTIEPLDFHIHNCTQVGTCVRRKLYGVSTPRFDFSISPLKDDRPAEESTRPNTPGHTPRPFSSPRHRPSALASSLRIVLKFLRRPPAGRFASPRNPDPHARLRWPVPLSIVAHNRLPHWRNLPEYHSYERK